MVPSECETTTHFSSRGIAASTTPGYLEKYEKMYEGIGLDKSSFDAAYDLGVRITPERFWAL